MAAACVFDQAAQRAVHDQLHLAAGVLSSAYTDQSTKATVRLVRSTVVSMAQELGDRTISEPLSVLAASALRTLAPGQVWVLSRAHMHACSCKKNGYTCTRVLFEFLPVLLALLGI